MAAQRLPRLPKLLDRKIYKTGQTRGADDDEIYQNRVGRTGTVLIPYSCWNLCSKLPAGEPPYEAGFIVLIPPDKYFSNPKITAELAAGGLVLGKNALVFYETREQWNAHNPDSLKWKPAVQRANPLGGKYAARISATTATSDGGKIVRGFNKTELKGAGIRVYEYASTSTTEQCRFQLEALFWFCYDSDAVAAANGMTAADASTRKSAILEKCSQLGLLDTKRLKASRIMDTSGKTMCPLCLEELSGQGFFTRMEQAEGRAVLDLTITQLNLFHIKELRFGVLNHRPYNVGWGHHHCNVVVKDAGILETIDWMRKVLNRNIEQGYLPAKDKAS